MYSLFPFTVTMLRFGSTGQPFAPESKSVLCRMSDTRIRTEAEAAGLAADVTVTTVSPLARAVIVPFSSTEAISG